MTRARLPSSQSCVRCKGPVPRRAQRNRRYVNSFAPEPSFHPLSLCPTLPLYLHVSAWPCFIAPLAILLSLNSRAQNIYPCSPRIDPSWLELSPPHQAAGRLRGPLAFLSSACVASPGIPQAATSANSRMTDLHNHPKRGTAQQVGPSASTDLAIWLFFQIAANHVLLPSLVATFLFSHSVVRHPTVISICCTWIITGIISSLLFYTGHHGGPEPPSNLCIAQAAMIAPVPPMASVAVLALVYYIWSAFRPSKLKAGQKTQHSRLVTVCLVVAPYVTYVGFAIGALIRALQHPGTVFRRYFYCSLEWDAYTDAMALFTASMCFLAIVLQVHLAFTLSRSWTALRRAGLSAGIDLQLTVRVVVFTAYILCAIGVMVATVANTKSVVPDMFAASIGMALFFVFATQPDVLRVWSGILLGRRDDSATNPLQDLPYRIPTPVPDFDCDLLERRDSDLSEKVRLAELHAYYKARTQELGVPVEIIRRPEDAFTLSSETRRLSLWKRAQPAKIY
ncbi:hypothetical protein C8Q74DRAFT_886525 [Fomes fomentarius]|nr:hypothetical protein C8Q74DRAFT_886525 [Fomes fomentarius]